MKFRSWNESTEKFNYFEDGRYYYFTTNLRGATMEIDCEERLEDSNFNWQNAEQSLIIDGKECFVGDYIQKFSTETCYEKYLIYLNEYGQPAIKMIAKNWEWQSNEEFEEFIIKTQYHKVREKEISLRDILSFEVIGNIHARVRK